MIFSSLESFGEQNLCVDEEHPLQFEVLKEGLLKNHGYCKAKVDGVLRSYVAANEGVFECTPPESEEGTWEIKQILDEEAVIWHLQTLTMMVKIISYLQTEKLMKSHCIKWKNNYNCRKSENYN